MRPFVVNGHGRLVFPSNFSADLDFSVLETLEQLEAVIRRDFEAKAPTGTEILERVDSNVYRSRYELLRDVAMNLVWGNRYAMTMYEKRPTRWRDLARRRDDVFLPLLTPWEEGERKVGAVAATCRAAAHVGRRRRGAGSSRFCSTSSATSATTRPSFRRSSRPWPRSPAIRRTSPSASPITTRTIRPGATRRSSTARRRCLSFEPLHRLAMVLHNRFPWDLARTRLVEVGSIGDDDFVVAFVPRNTTCSSSSGA